MSTDRLELEALLVKLEVMDALKQHLDRKPVQDKDAELLALVAKIESHTKTCGSAATVFMLVAILTILNEVFRLF